VGNATTIARSATLKVIKRSPTVAGDAPQKFFFFSYHGELGEARTAGLSPLFPGVNPMNLKIRLVASFKLSGKSRIKSQSDTKV
jgi:hypothetical protein